MTVAAGVAAAFALLLGPVATAGATTSAAAAVPTATTTVQVNIGCPSTDWPWHC